MKSVISIYTDGACSGNGLPSITGGWSAVLENHEKQLRISGQGSNATNNRMELQGAIEGLRAVRNQEAEIHLYTDSKYVQKGAEALPEWKARGWRTKAKTPVKNQDLWEILDGLQQKLNVVFRWVRGHSGHPMNELADTLAVAAVRGQCVRQRRKAGDVSLGGS